MMAKAVTQTTSPLRAALEARLRARETAGPEWLARRRDAARDAFTRHGIPTTRSEAWKKTSLKALDEARFAPEGTKPGGIATRDLDTYRLGTVDRHEMVFVDGVFDATLSRLDALPEGVEVCTLTEAIARNDAGIQGLGSLAATDAPDAALSALNMAGFEDGAFIRIGKRTVLDAPLHVLWIATPVADGMHRLICPRTLVVAEELTEATVIESFCGVEGTKALVAATTEIQAQEDATVTHVTIQRESRATTHIHHIHGQAGRDSRIATFVHSEGAAVARNECVVRLADPGAACGLHGLFLGAGDQHVDNHTMIDHMKPHTDSVENYRGIMTGASHGVFTGNILVRKDAQKTDSKQENKNLILSDRAHVDTTPQLEIFADDVKCSHGSTIGQLDERSLFYLRSRGYAKEEARLVLTQAFAGDVIGAIRHEGLRALLEARVAAWFADDRKEAAS